MEVLGGAGLFLISEEPLYGAGGFSFPLLHEKERGWEKVSTGRKKTKDRDTSVIRNSNPLGSYGRNMFRALSWSYWGGLLLMSVVSLHRGRGA